MKGCASKAQPLEGVPGIAGRHTEMTVRKSCLKSETTKERIVHSREDYEGGHGKTLEYNSGRSSRISEKALEKEDRRGGHKGQTRRHCRRVQITLIRLGWVEDVAWVPGQGEGHKVKPEGRHRGPDACGSREKELRCEWSLTTGQGSENYGNVSVVGGTSLRNARGERKLQKGRISTDESGDSNGSKTAPIGVWRSKRGRATQRDGAIQEKQYQKRRR